MNGFFSWGLPLGRVAGIQVRIHWTLLLFWAYQLEPLVRHSDEGSRLPALTVWAVWVGLLFASIFLHELGHSFAARYVGGNAEEILLWPLGGLAMCRCPDVWRSHLIVAAGGPAVTIVIVLLSFAGFSLADQLFPPDPWSYSLRAAIYDAAREVLLWWNLIILIFNLIPLYPLDGGRILHSSLWGFFSRRGGYVWGGYSRASQVTLLVSRITAIAGIAYAVWARRPFLVLIFIWALMGAESLRDRE